MEFKQAMRILKRMCSERSCEKCECKECCPYRIHPTDFDAALVEPILDKWAAEHPEKTLMDDFFEKYPKATRDKDGGPLVCAKDIGYLSKCPSAPDNLVTCAECWRRPLEEVE